MQKCDTRLAIGRETQVDIIDAVMRSLGLVRGSAVCADLSPIMIRGLEPNYRRDMRGRAVVAVRHQKVDPGDVLSPRPGG